MEIIILLLVVIVLGPIIYLMALGGAGITALFLARDRTPADALEQVLPQLEVGGDVIITEWPANWSGIDKGAVMRRAAELGYGKTGEETTGGKVLTTFTRAR
ncbi:hypothetical protein [Micrococcus luteus]|uniref:hypothetical protein n=1 Tax=Micrococcus luteus TaxID=1270 RepID=UPI001A95A6EF|nr:hypothetical protein [Micrococcus luteus]MBO1029699.1 hypothetical protein [Micrococcus luteus]MCV7500493.1 hypothetical protein [Micrococcus luteus]MCV7660127.1 hypothetical protein [Micrococcus luteus]MCV7662067.1 hypothetical protein [Micrococcus luteus]